MLSNLAPKNWARTFAVGFRTEIYRNHSFLSAKFKNVNSWIDFFPFSQNIKNYICKYLFWWRFISCRSSEKRHIGRCIKLNIQLNESTVIISIFIVDTDIACQKHALFVLKAHTSGSFDCLRWTQSLTPILFTRFKEHETNHRGRTCPVARMS